MPSADAGRQGPNKPVLCLRAVSVRDKSALQPSRIRSALMLVLFASSCFVLASAPRLTERAVQIPTDEPLWFRRTTLFAQALRRHDWSGTYQTGHPGVT